MSLQLLKVKLETLIGVIKHGPVLEVEQITWRWRWEQKTFLSRWENRASDNNNSFYEVSPLSYFVVCKIDILNNVANLS